MATDAYKNVFSQAKELDFNEQLLLLEELARFVRERSPVPRKHNITELEGLGKEIWEGIDPAEYINEERNSWGR